MTTQISGDMAVKLVAGAVVLGVVGVSFYKLRKLAINIAPAINPADPDNVVNQTVATVGGALVTDPQGPGKNADGSWTLGGWLHDVMNPDTAQAVKDASGPVKPAPTSEPYWHYDAMGNPIGYYKD